MEVENVHELTSFVNNHLVFFVLQGNELVGLDIRTKNGLVVAHFLVESTKLTVSEILIVEQAPLSPAIMITIVVSGSGEINPLRMAELISHEVEVCLSSEGRCDKSDHFMEGHSSAYSERWLLSPVHTVVDFFLKQMHGLGLVANDGLVV